MQFNRPVVLSIAGLDPCGGAGLLADTKTFELHHVYGLGVTTAQTLQTEKDFVSVRWESDEDILKAITHLLGHYKVTAVKIGIVQSINSLNKIVTEIKSIDPSIRIVVDPIIRSTTAFNFWQDSLNESLLYELLNKIQLITPNYKEIVQLVPDADANDAAMKLSQCCNVLLKGGHNEAEPGVDYLYTKSGVEKLQPTVSTAFPKHGSGCVLSAAIAANLALGNDLITACKKAKSYTEKFLLSNPSLLGFHAA